jgi:hypothetical protein
MIKKLYISIVTTLAIGALLWALVDYFTLPVVGINSEGKCAYIETQGVRDYNCDMLPSKYIKENVQ